MLNLFIGIVLFFVFAKFGVFDVIEYELISFLKSFLRKLDL